MSNEVVLLGAGPNADVMAQTDRSHRALRTSMRPWEHDSGGHYRSAARSGALTGAGVVAGGPLFSFQWNPPGGMLAALLRLRAFYVPTVAFTAAQELGLDLVHVTGFTGADSTGTAITPTQMRKGMQSSVVSDCRIAAATVLTAGTRVVDATSVLEIGGGLVNVVNAAAATAYVNPSSGGMPQFGFDYDPLMRGEMPLIMTKGEGFLVRNTVVFPAAGTCTLVVVASVVEFPAAGSLIIAT